MAIESAPIRIVIAEEYLFYRQGLRMFLEGHDDITVVGEAGTSQEALSLVQSTRPSILMFDLDLPPKGGVAYMFWAKSTERKFAQSS